MELLDALRKQQELYDRIYPKYLRESVLKIPNILHVEAATKNMNLSYLDNFRKPLELASSIHEIIKVPDWYKAITKNAALTAYSKQLDALNAAILKSNIDLQFDYILKNLSYAEYDLLELNTFEQDDDTKTKEEKTRIILNETKTVQYILKEIYHNNAKLSLISPREFEMITAEILFKQGYEVQLTKQTRDNGYDILAIKKIDSYLPLKFLVECKRYDENRKVGVEIVRAFKDVVLTGQANRGMIVTTSYFTKGAEKKRIKEAPYMLDFTDRNAFIKLINDYWIK